MNLSVWVCSYLYVWEIVWARIYLFPLVQCTYIGPTVQVHSFPLSAHHQPINFLTLRLFNKTEQARLVFHLCSQTHLYTLHIMFIISDQTQASVCCWQQLPLNKMLVNKCSRVLSLICFTMLQRARKDHKTCMTEKATCHSVLIHYTSGNIIG